MRVEDFQGHEPRFAPEVYFDGLVRAWGIFEDRFGRLRRQFTVAIDGNWDGTTLTLNEDFIFADGQTEQRVWAIKRIDANTYEATADNIVGTASGRCFGNAIQWRYTYALAIAGRDRHIHFDDWMFQQDRDIVVNRARLSKWGIELGSTTIFFQRAEAQRDAA
ncbi:MAG: DUF3833 domain-containing protein [Pseudomonadota bacterium]